MIIENNCHISLYSIVETLVNLTADEVVKHLRPVTKSWEKY